jgi:hypothetical protein
MNMINLAARGFRKRLLNGKTTEDSRSSVIQLVNQYVYRVEKDKTNENVLHETTLMHESNRIVIVLRRRNKSED